MKSAHQGMTPRDKCTPSASFIFPNCHEPRKIVGTSERFSKSFFKVFFLKKNFFKYFLEVLGGSKNVFWKKKIYGLGLLKTSTPPSNGSEPMSILFLIEYCINKRKVKNIYERNILRTLPGILTDAETMKLEAPSHNADKTFLTPVKVILYICCTRVW